MNIKIKKDIEISLERAYKEYEFEKWHFGINKDTKENVAFIHFGEGIQIDLIINQKYRYLRKQIVEGLDKILGIPDFDKKTNIYFFNYQFDEKRKNKNPGLYVGKIELGVGYDD